MRHHKDIILESFPDVSAHITWSENGAGPIMLRGYAIDSNTGIRKEYAKEPKRKAETEDDIPFAIQYLITAILDDVKKNERKATSKLLATTGKSPIRLAFEALESSGEPVSSDWGEEYEKKKLSYFRCKILPTLEEYDLDISNDELHQKIVEKIMTNGNSAKHEPTAAETATKSLIAADIIYQRLRDFDPSLPSLSLRPIHKGRRRKNEQIKSLPRSIRRKFARLIEKYIDENPRLAISIIAMYDAGLRSAEAAAVWIDVILSYQDTDCIFVRYQIKNGKRCAILKSSNSYRVVPLSAWGKEMLHRCTKQLSDDPNDVQYWGCDPRHLSSTIRKMLIEAGLSADYLREANASMREKPDYDDSRRPIYDLSAYILRRDWASRARNICGFSSLEIDYCLGHNIRIAQKKREDFRHPSNLVQLAVKLERHIHNPEISAHPGCTPYCLQHSTELDLIPFDTIRMRNMSNECVCVALDIKAELNCESIIILAPNDSLQPNRKARSIATHCTRNNNPVIGKAFTPEDNTNESNNIQWLGQ